MGNIVLSLFVNGLMALLLLVTILYCWRLNSRIRILQDSKSELARIIREFDESTKRATQSIAEIHEATSRLSENIQHKIDKANFLADDLQHLIERGSKVTGKPEPMTQPRATPTPPAPPQMARTIDPAAIRPARSPIAATKDTPVAAFEPAKAAPEPGAGGMRRALRMRSKAEQELMQAVGNKTESEN